MECSVTWRDDKPANVPQSVDTYRSIELLCRVVLDPVCERFGPLRLTYGFSARALCRQIRERGRGPIAPSIDQHAGCEVTRIGKPICRRLGMAADFDVPGVKSHVLAAWVLESCDFDRLYFYEDNRPIHVSVGPERARYVRGRLKIQRFLALTRSAGSPTGGKR
jgi:hypothetical protein